MKSPYVNELKADQTITATLLVQTKDIRQKKTGDPYLSLQLSDKTGDLDSKMWDNAAEVLDTFSKDDFVRVKGLVQVFQNRLQMVIHKLQRVDEAEIDLSDFLPASKRDSLEMDRELREVIAGMGNPHLRGLLEAIFRDEAMALAFRMAPAAKSVHHGYLSGLIEHVLSMVKLAKFAASHYEGVDADLLVAGVILHDIGKTRELLYQRTLGYSDEGQLIGHIVMGYELVSRTARELPDFPPKLLLLLEHLILSHHGELAFGSPKTPLFPEALLLHHIDNLDSKMETMRAHAERDTLVEGNWTAYSGILERAVLKKKRFLDGAPPREAGSAQTSSGHAPPAKPAQSAPAHHGGPRVSNNTMAEKLSQALKPS